MKEELLTFNLISSHRRGSISSSNLDEAHIKRVAIACAAEVVALVSSEKLGTAGPYVVALLSD